MAEVLAVDALLQRDDLADPVAGSLDCFRDVSARVHVVLAEVGEDHALPAPTLDRQGTATELLEGILARYGAAVSATTTRTDASNPEAQLHDAVKRYADGLALAATQVRVDFDVAPVGPLPWLVGIPADLAEHPAWGPYLTARARRVSTLAIEVQERASTTLPEWMDRYDERTHARASR